MLAVASCRCWAQEDVTAATATDALGTVLFNLKQSVEQLNADNKQLIFKNDAIKQEINRLRQQLGQLQQQEDLLNKKAVKLQDRDPNRAGEISRLEKESLDLDRRIGKAQEELKWMKMISDSRRRQELLRKAILDYEKQAPLLLIN